MTRHDDLRLVQVFLSRRWGVFEVSASLDQDDLVTCSCPGFRVRSDCKHVRFVRGRTIEGGLRINVTVVPPLDLATYDAARFRAWMLRHGRVEVL
jgi:hypothetical protein